MLYGILDSHGDAIREKLVKDKDWELLTCPIMNQ
jgi:hypothetical protein